MHENDPDARQGCRHRVGAVAQGAQGQPKEGRERSAAAGPGADGGASSEAPRAANAPGIARALPGGHHRQCLGGACYRGGRVLPVILVDANLLIYAHVSTFSRHEAARAWLAAERAWIPQPTERHREILGELLAAPGVHANLVQDAHLAALAIEHGLILCSTDGDFARFPGLRWENPLLGEHIRAARC